MSLMDWNAKLDIGVSEMNHQHQGLLKIMNQLFDLHKEKAPFSSQKIALDRLKVATIEHFQQEEAYMDEIGFGDSNLHKMIHQKLLKTFTEHYQSALALNRLDDEFFSFLRFWLAAHIQGIDMKYGEYSKARQKYG